MQIVQVKTLSEQIYKSLRDEIVSQNIKSGTKLTLEMLKSRFSVSSTPIREALNRLIQDGLLTYQPNIGISVKRLSKRDIFELFQLNSDLECLAVKYCFENGNEADMLEDLKGIVDNTVMSLQEGDYTEWCKWSDEFHYALVRHCGNSRLCDSAERISGQLIMLATSYQHKNSYWHQITDEHTQIYEELKNHDVNKACMLIKNHLARSINYALAI